MPGAYSSTKAWPSHGQTPATYGAAGNGSSALGVGCPGGNDRGHISWPPQGTPRSLVQREPCHDTAGHEFCSEHSSGISKRIRTGNIGCQVWGESDDLELRSEIRLSCGRVAQIVGLHCIRTIDFLDTGGVVTTMGSPARWKKYVIENAASRINAIWGKRNAIFVHDIEPYISSPLGLPPWLFYVWLRCDKGISPRANGSQLVVIFFRQDIDSGIDEIACEPFAHWTGRTKQRTGLIPRIIEDAMWPSAILASAMKASQEMSATRTTAYPCRCPAIQAETRKLGSEDPGFDFQHRFEVARAGAGGLARQRRRSWAIGLDHRTPEGELERRAQASAILSRHLQRCSIQCPESGDRISVACQPQHMPSKCVIA